MQSAQEINWWLEGAKVVIPVVATIVVGWWITRGNEKFKNELAQDLHRFQTRDSLLHQKQAEAIEELYFWVVTVDGRLRKIVLALHSDEFKWNLDALNDSLRSTLLELGEANDKLTSLFLRKQILLDKETCQMFREVWNPLLDIEKGLSGLFLTEKSGIKFRNKTAQDLWDESTALLATIPPLKEKLEGRFREILAPLPARRD